MMRIAARTARVIAVTGLLALAGCAGTEGSGGPGSSPSLSVSVPGVEQLSAALLTPADLTGPWTAGSAAGDGDQVRLITYNLQCPAAADALAAAERIEVDASTALQSSRPVGRCSLWST